MSILFGIKNPKFFCNLVVRKCELTRNPDDFKNGKQSNIVEN